MTLGRLLVFADMQIQELEKELEAVKKERDELLLFCQGSFVRTDEHAEVIHTNHFRDALAELTRRQTYTKHECALLIAEQTLAREKAEAKAAAFDWLVSKMQEAYDQSGWVEVGDLSIGAQTIWGRRDECLVKAEIQWKDRRDEPLNLLDAINKAITEAGGES